MQIHTRVADITLPTAHGSPRQPDSRCGGRLRAVWPSGQCLHQQCCSIRSQRDSYRHSGRCVLYWYCIPNYIHIILGWNIFKLMWKGSIYNVTLKIKNSKGPWKWSQVPVLARMEVAFPRCTATDQRYTRYSVDFESPDSSDMRRPSSLNNVNDFGPMAPRDSMATGENMCPDGSPLYFSLNIKCTMCTVLSP